MSGVKFDMKPITEKPNRRYRKGSKYDPVLDSFIEGEADLSEVSIEGKEANYIRTQLNKRIEARAVEDVKVSVINNVVYLEKTCARAIAFKKLEKCDEAIESYEKVIKINPKNERAKMAIEDILQKRDNE